MSPKTRVDTTRSKPLSAADARAEVEARRESVLAERRAAMDERYAEGIPGRGIVVCSWVTTAAFAAVTVPAVLDPERFIVAFFVVSLALFFIGSASFFIDIVLAAARSREDAMGIGGLFLMLGSTPRSIQWHLLGSMGLQVVVALLGAALHPFTPLAFGTLVPICGLSLCGLWTVRHGVFAAREDSP